MRKYRFDGNPLKKNMAEAELVKDSNALEEMQKQVGRRSVGQSSQPACQLADRFVGQRVKRLANMPASRPARLASPPGEPWVAPGSAGELSPRETWEPWGRLGSPQGSPREPQGASGTSGEPQGAPGSPFGPTGTYFLACEVDSFHWLRL